MDARVCFESGARDSWSLSRVALAGRIVSVLLPVFMLTACGSAQDMENGNDEGEGEELVSQSEQSLTYGSVSGGSYWKTSFQKQAQEHYTICINVLSGDADLYGHYTGYPTKWDYQYKSTNDGTAPDCIGFTAVSSGTYYISVYGFVPGTSAFNFSISN